MHQDGLCGILVSTTYAKPTEILSVITTQHKWSAELEIEIYMSAAPCHHKHQPGACNVYMGHNSIYCPCIQYLALTFKKQWTTLHGNSS